MAPPDDGVQVVLNRGTNAEATETPTEAAIAAPAPSTEAAATEEVATAPVAPVAPEAATPTEAPSNNSLPRE